MLFVIGVWTFLRALLLGSAAIALENLALRHQLRVLQRSGEAFSVSSLPGGGPSPRRDQASAILYSATSLLHARSASGLL